MRSICLVVVVTLVVGCSQDSHTSGKYGNARQVAPTVKTPNDDVEQVVRSVVAECLGVKPQSLDMKKPILDELDVADVVMTLEERFMFEIPDEVIEKHARAKLGEPTCKLSPSQLVTIVEESRALADRRK